MKSKSLKKLFACFIFLGVIFAAGITASVGVSAESGITVSDYEIYAAYDDSDLYFDYTVYQLAGENFPTASRDYTLCANYSTDWGFVSVSSKNEIESLTIPKRVIFKNINTNNTVFSADITRVCSFTDLEELGYSGYGSNNDKFRSSVKKLVLPDTINYISDTAFDGYESLEEINIPGGVESIPDNAFKNLKNLKKVVIANGVTSIGRNAFEGCSSLTEVIIPDSVTSIGNYAFAACTSLSEITIPNSVTGIGYNTFSGCVLLKNVVIPDNVTTVYFGSAESEYSVIKATGKEDTQNYFFILDNDSLTFVGAEDSENINSETLKVPNTIVYRQQTLSVTGAGHLNDFKCYSQNYQFNGFRKTVKEIILPDTIRIKEQAFKFCQNLEKINIPSKTESIPAYAFDGCESLNFIEIPDGVTSIGEGAFAGCTSLSSIEIPNSVQVIKDRAFYASGLEHFEVSSVSALNQVEYAVFSHCTNLKSVYLPNTTKIGERVFQGCTSLEKAVLPSAAQIPNYLFKDCTSLKEFDVLPKVTKIGSYAFLHCSSFERLNVLSQKITYISANSFIGCSDNLTVYAKKDTYAADFAALNQIPFSEVADMKNNSEVTVVNENGILQTRVSASASDGFGNYQYAVYYKWASSNDWILLQGYSENADVSFKIHYAQEYNVCIKIMDSDKTVSCKYLAVNSAYPVQAVFRNVSSVSAETVVLGEKIDISADTVYDIDCQYSVHYKKTGSSQWTTVQEYSKNKNLSVELPSVGEYVVCVKAMDCDGLISCKYFMVQVKKPSFENTSTISSETLLQGETLIMNGSSVGGYGDCRYAFYFKPASSAYWTEHQAYSSNATVSLTPQYCSNYDICIKVKDSMGTVKKKYLTLKVIRFENTSIVSSANLKLGQTLTMYGSAKGGASGYQYCFWIKKPNSSWKRIQNYSQKSTAKFTPDTVGIYEVCIKVKDGSSYEEKKYFTITVE